MRSRRRTQSGSTVGGRKHVIAPVCFLQISDVLKDYGGLVLEMSRAGRPTAPENYTSKGLREPRPCLSFCNETNFPFGGRFQEFFLAIVNPKKKELGFGKKKIPV